MNARWTQIAVCIGLAFLLGLPAAHADDDGREPVVGSWRLTVSDPPGGFFSLTTFHADNTIIDRPSTTPNVGLGIGAWEAIGRDDDDDDDGRRRGSGYAATFDSFVDSDFDSNFDIRVRVRLTVYVRKDKLVGTGTVEVRSLDDAVLLAGPFPTATLEGTRITVIPE